MRTVKCEGFVWVCAAALAVVLWLAACNPPPAPPPETPLPLAWQAQVSNVINRPTVSDGLIFVVEESGKLTALDVESGTKRWQADLVRNSHSDDPVGADGGYVFATAHGDEGKALAFDAQTGAEQWAVASGPSRYAEHPLAHEGVIYYEATGPEARSASLHAADAATGATLWEFPLRSNMVTSPILGAELVYAGAYDYDTSTTKTRHVFAIDKATGQQRWTYQSDLDLHSKLALDDAHLYIGAGAGVVMARDAATGGPGWTARPGALLSNSPTVVGDLLYIGNKENQMIALNTEDGSQRWSLDVDSPVLTQVAVSDGVAYFGTNDGYFYAVDALTGAELWRVQSPVRKLIGVGEIVPAMGTTPVVAGDLLLYFNGHALNALKLR